MLLFKTPGDYAAFENFLHQAYDQMRARIAAYCLMPNHWHVLLWPWRGGELSGVLPWITVTHPERCHGSRHSAGTGPVYQRGFKSFPLQLDENSLAITGYADRNALRAN